MSKHALKIRGLLVTLMMLGASGTALSAETQVANAPSLPSIDLSGLQDLPGEVSLVKAEHNSALSPVQYEASNYEVLEVLHARAFVRGPRGVKARGELKKVPLLGNSRNSEAFSTVVRVKNAARINAPIEVEVVDYRGEVVMSARGKLFFPKGKNEVTHYQVDWDPTFFRFAGQYRIQVRIADQKLGSWPLELEGQS